MNESYNDEKIGLKEYYKDKYVIKAIIVIFIYFLLFQFIIPTFIFELIARLVLPFYDKNGHSLEKFIDLYKGTKIFNDFSNRVNVLNNLFAYCVLFTTTILLLKPHIKNDYCDFKENTQKTASSFWKSFGLYYAIIFGVGIFQSMLVERLNAGELVSENQNSIDAILSSGALNFILVVIPIVILGPIVEELVFRKGIFTAIKNKYIAFACSSLIFGLIHVIDDTTTTLQNRILVSITYIGGGIGLSYAYYKTKNVLVCILIHIFHNLFSVIISLLLTGFIHF